MDLQKLQTQVAIIKDIITAASAFMAAIIAVLGVGAWKTQLKWKVTFDLAQKMLRVVYQLRGAFDNLRNIVLRSSSDEVALALKEGNIDLDQLDDKNKKEMITTHAVYRMKLRKISDLMLEIDALSLEGEAIWDKKIHDALQPLRKSVNLLCITNERYMSRIEQGFKFKPGEEFDRDELIMYDTGLDENFFTKEYTAAVQQIEKFLKPYLKDNVFDITPFTFVIIVVLMLVAVLGVVWWVLNG